MAFTRANLGVVTQSASQDQKFAIWLYKTADTLATVTTAAYFGSVVAEGVINSNDLILVIASDGVTLGRFTNVTSDTAIVVSDLSTGGGSAAAIPNLGGNLTGTVDGDLVDIAGSGADANINANFKEIQTTVNNILAALRAQGIIAP